MLLRVFFCRFSHPINAGGRIRTCEGTKPLAPGASLFGRLSTPAAILPYRRFSPAFFSKRLTGIQGFEPCPAAPQAAMLSITLYAQKRICCVNYIGLNNILTIPSIIKPYNMANGLKTRLPISKNIEVIMNDIISQSHWEKVL